MKIITNDIQPDEIKPKETEEQPKCSEDDPKFEGRRVIEMHERTPEEQNRIINAAFERQRIESKVENTEEKLREKINEHKEMVKNNSAYF